MNIAHRGFSSQYPENTLLSFQKALDLGVSWIEFDLQITSDNHLVVMHDRTVDRTTNGSGEVSDLTLSQIKTLDAGIRFHAQFAGECVPTFEETLDLLQNRAHMAVELKFENDDPIPQVIDILRQRNLINQVSISSFDLSKLPEIKKLCPECSTTALLKPENDPNRDWVAVALDLGVDVFGPRHTHTTKAMIDQAHNKNLIVRCWGLGRDQGPGLERLIDLCADGTTTDCPDILQNILRRRNLL
jgi:glycerophosphoryl diester phosphodiesterase